MRHWASKAKEIFPELNPETVDSLGTPLELWDHLFIALLKAYEVQPPHEELIASIYRYAAWCLTQAPTGEVDTDVSNAAAIGLVENITLSRAVRDDLHRWMSEETFEGFEQLFRYHLSDEDYRAFAREFSTRRRTHPKAAVL